MSDVKHCPQCARTLSVTAFYTVKKPTGLRTSGYCRECTKARAVAWLDAQPPEWHAAKNKRDAARYKTSATPEQRAARAEAMRKWARRKRADDPAWAAQKRADNQNRLKANPEASRIKNACSNGRARAKMAGLPYGFSTRDWAAVLDAFGHACAFCGAAQCLLDLEHLVPIRQGGGHIVGNVVPACRPCNAQKASRTLSQFAALRGITQGELDDIVRRASLQHAG